MRDQIALFLMTEKGYRVLEVIVDRFPGTIEQVVCARDSNVAKDFYDEIKTVCSNNKIKFSDRHDAISIRARYAIAISWRWLIDVSSTTLIVFHDSLLPKYRGFAPLVSALINAEPTIGVTALFANEDYDCGDVIAQSSSEVHYPIKIQTAIELIARNYEELAIEIMGTVAAGKSLHRLKQSECDASYSLWRDDRDYIIDWTNSAERIKRMIDAVGYPYKGAFTKVDGIGARVLDAEVVDDVIIENRNPGKVIFVKNNRPVVVCGKGLIHVIDLVDDNTNKTLLPLKVFRLRFE